MKKNVTFILPPEIGHPIGGYKIVYEYANRLLENGWQVNIGYDCRRVGCKLHIWHPLKMLIVKAVSEFRCWHNPKWFKLSNGVGKYCVYGENDIHATDNLVATAVGTADLVYKAKKCNRLYLIQDFENWGEWTSEAVKNTYRLGMVNIVIAKWLKDVVDGSVNNDNSVLISNGIDSLDFYVTRPIETRKMKSICMLYHKGEYKGSKYGIQVLLKLKEIYPELKATIFGTPNRPHNLPLWIEYKQNVNVEQLREIYNNSAIFIYPSIEEGFGLTCVESMFCGCALCATNYRGVHEFAIDEENALLSPVRDVKSMVDNVCRLFDDDNLRVKLAQKGMDTVKVFDWEKSIEKFERILQ